MDKANCNDSDQPRLTHAHPKASQETLIGEAGVHLVISKLLAWRIPTREAMAGLPYDIIADDENAGLLRIQVKTTTRLYGRKLRFRMRRGFYYSRRGTFDYEATDFDIAAFVHLPAGKLCFWVAPRRSIAIYPEWLTPPDVEYKTWLLALEHYERLRTKRAVRLLPACDATPVTPSGSSTPSVPPKTGPSAALPRILPPADRSTAQ